MKKILSLLLVLVGSMSMMAETIPADDPRVVFIGRTQVLDHSVRFDWSATYLRVAFTGKELRMRVSDTGRNLFNLIIDRPLSAEPDQVVITHGQDSVITLFAGKKGNHTIILQKRNEGEQGITTILGFETDGVFTQAEKLKDRQIEILGDSYTCGYGTENSGRRDPFKPETESAPKSYGGILARYFDADYIQIAHSGMGIARNYNTKFPNWYMPDRYMQIFDMDSTQANRWSITMSEFRPDITIIFLGANDFSCKLQPSYEDYKQHYYQLIREIKANYGEDHPILCCTKKGADALFAYVQRLIIESEFTNVYYVGLFEALFHNDDRDLGASFHPNYVAHQKVAHVLAPYVGTITNWELQDKPIK